MEQITRLQNFVGSVDFFEDLERNIFLAKPHGIINPSLLKEDVLQARQFANRCDGPWTYVTNTEDVVLVNPFNLRYLKEVKKIKKLKKIVIFAPNPVNRFLIRLVPPIVQPDVIISDKEVFKTFLLTLK